MTRIYTNIPSMVAQRSLQANMSSLETSLQRLSTGLRINSGKDDPAGLIASEMLRSEITSIKQGIANTERANNMIAVADSALNEIAGLLNQIRGLVNEAANTGTMSLEMLKANQMQVDMMLDSIDRIASQTNFMGRKLLDGSLDFEVAGVNRTEIQDLHIYEVKFSDSGPIDVEVKLHEAAEKAALYYAHSVAQTDVELTIGGNLGQVTQRFSQGATVADIAAFVNGTTSATGVSAVVHSDATYGTLITSSVGPNNDIIIRAGEAGQDAGFFQIKYVLGNDRGLVVEYEESLGSGYPATAVVHLQTTAWESARASHVDSTAGKHDNNALEFIANITGEHYNDVSIHYVDGNLTDEFFADPLKNPSGVVRGINTYYSDVPKAATALIGDVNGLSPMDSLEIGQYLKFTATQSGSEMNNVRIEFVQAAASVGNNRAKAELTTDTNGDKVYRIYVDVYGSIADPTVVPAVPATTFKDIQAAIAKEGSFKLEFSDSSITNKYIKAGDVIEAGGDGFLSNPADPNSPRIYNAAYGNTSNSGGEAKTLYVVMTTADPPAYVGLKVNEPLTAFVNFADGDEFSLKTNLEGFDNTKINFTIATENDKVWGTKASTTFVIKDMTSPTGSVTFKLEAGEIGAHGNISIAFASGGGGHEWVNNQLIIDITQSDYLTAIADIDLDGVAFAAFLTTTINNAAIPGRPATLPPSTSPYTVKALGGTWSVKPADSIVLGTTIAATNGTSIDPALHSPNVAAQYDEINQVLNVYIKSTEPYVPLIPGDIMNVTFEDIQAAIWYATYQNSEDVLGRPQLLPPGVFEVTLTSADPLLGPVEAKLITLDDLNYPIGKPIPLDGLVSPDEVYVRWQPDYQVDNIRFIEGLADSSSYDPMTKELTVTLRVNAAGSVIDLAAIKTLIETATTGVPTMVPSAITLELLAGAGSENILLDDIIPAYPLTLGANPIILRDGTQITVNSKLEDTTVTLQFVMVEEGPEIRAEFEHCYPSHVLTVYVRDDAEITYDHLNAVLLGVRVPDMPSTPNATPNYVTEVFWLDDTLIDPFANTRLLAGFQFDVAENTGASGFSTTTTLHKGIDYTHYGPNTANDIMHAFDMTRAESIGNERAAELFTVWRSRDNDGTGIVYGAMFNEVLTGGQDGGKIVNTAQEVVAALNNSKYWGTEMTQATLQKWIADGTAESRTTIPVIVASLAPGNHGLSIVSEFSEVAYYGSPYDGTGLQFLGPTGSAPIRFVVGGPDTNINSPLSLDWESIADKLDFPKAVLTAANANAELIITAKKQGKEFDDVYFRIVRAYEDPTATPPVVRNDGWGTYDDGLSYAEALLTFTNPSNGINLLNTAFTITANDRGDGANNTNIAMRQDPNQEESIIVRFDTVKNELQISLRSSELSPETATGGKAITANDIIAAINKDSDGNGLSDCGFNAALSYAIESNNNGMGTFAGMGLSTSYMSIGNTKNSGGHNGTVTLYLAGPDPTANQIIDIIKNDDILNKMFEANAYAAGMPSASGLIDFVKDTGIVSTGGVVEQGVLVVHLATDATGLAITTAADLVAFWDKLTAEETRGISASLLREANAVWDECDDPYGKGILPPTPTVGEECEDIRYLDTYFVGWSDAENEPLQYVPQFARGTMTSINGENASFDLVARRTGADFNGYSLVYVQDDSLTGKYDDNITGPDGTILYNGIRLSIDEKTHKIFVSINEGVTTANDIKLLIESNTKTKQMFTVELHGNGTGKITTRDDTLLTSGGTIPPGNLSGAKLLFGRDATEYALEFLSEGYGTRQYVSVIANNGVFTVVNNNGKEAERAYGVDANVTVNGVRAFADGNNVTLSTSTMSMEFQLSSLLESGYSSSFAILGGGATFQMGPQVIANQQITIGIQSVNTNSLGGVSGKMYMLRTGEAASLLTDPGTKLADRIVQEAIVNVTSIRGRLGSIQKYTFEPNVNVLNDTLEALSAAESDIRDADFAEESSNLTRNQVLVQSAISTLGIANQLPNYILGLLQR